uniref:Uncharacterized protein n=1 Tax=Anguilla anguilla TaxID=7936 RepID=A0A0E9X2M5_ANGAN
MEEEHKSLSCILCKMVTTAHPKNKTKTSLPFRQISINRHDSGLTSSGDSPQLQPDSTKSQPPMWRFYRVYRLNL